MAEITLDSGNGQQIASVIRKASIGDLGSKPASRRVAIIKGSKVTRARSNTRSSGSSVEVVCRNQLRRASGLQEFQSVTHLTLV